MCPGVEGVRGHYVAGGVGAVIVQSDPAPGVRDRPVQHGVDVVRPILVPPGAGGREGVRVVEQPQRRRVPGTATGAELHEQTADLAGKGVLRLAGDTPELVEGPVGELAPSFHRKADRPMREREVRSVPERFQVRIEQVQDGAVGRQCHLTTLEVVPYGSVVMPWGLCPALVRVPAALPHAAVPHLSTRRRRLQRLPVLVQ